MESQTDYEKAYEIGLEAYIYGTPLLETNKTFLNMTNVGSADDKTLRINRFKHIRTTNDPKSKAVVAPGASGLSSIAWLDLSDEPQVLHIPKITDHFFVLALLDPYTEDIINLGSANDTPEGDYVICGPAQRGVPIPKGTTKISVDYNRIWLIGSTQLKGVEDIHTVNKIQDGYTLTPLSKYGIEYQMPSMPDVTKTENLAKTYGIPTGMDFYDTLCQLIQQFPPKPEDESILKTFLSVGIGPGRTPSNDQKLSAETVRGLLDAVTDGPEQIKLVTKKVFLESAKKHNGYFLGGFGNYGTNYSLRAVVATMGLGAFTSEQTIFALTLTDQELQPLNGSERYVMHLAKAPPVTEGWSITVYDTKGALIQNSINRYQFNNASDLAINADGSVDIIFQTTQPTDSKDTQNWLPVAAGQGFQVIFRLMAPEKDSIRDILNGGGWQPPVISHERENE